jgi:GNAT superfamily N-acetyltransferase
VSSARVRRATVDDVTTIARHRAAMFVDMGRATVDLVERLVEDTEVYLRDALPREEYLGWLASPEEDDARIVAGAGVQRRRVLPFPRTGGVAFGHQAIVLNVYTEPAFRRHGLARRLMSEILAWARAVRIESLVLHAAHEGRPLYEQLGFVSTNEMRYHGDL